MELNEHTLQQILTGQREEYQRYLGVVAEDFKSQVKLVAEILGNTQEQLVAIREMVAMNTEDIAIIKMELSIMRSDLKEKVGRDEFGVLEARVAKLERSGRA